MDIALYKTLPFVITFKPACTCYARPSGVSHRLCLYIYFALCSIHQNHKLDHHMYTDDAGTGPIVFVQPRHRTPTKAICLLSPGNTGRLTGDANNIQIQRN